MKLNTDKCHLIINSQKHNALKIVDLHINNSLSEKSLGLDYLGCLNFFNLAYPIECPNLDKYTISCLSPVKLCKPNPTAQCLLAKKFPFETEEILMKKN